MAASDIDVLVDELVIHACVVVSGSVGVQCPRIEIGRHSVSLPVNVVVSSHDAGRHVIKTPFRYGAVEDGDGKIWAPEGGSGVETDISRHAHVHASEGAAYTAVLGTPITHDETLETELAFEEIVQSLRVLAAVTIVDLVVGAHDGTGASAYGISEGPSNQSALGDRTIQNGYSPQVEFVHGRIIDVRARCLQTATRLAIMLLLIQNKVFCASDHTGGLDASDRLTDGNTGEHRVWAEACKCFSL